MAGVKSCRGAKGALAGLRLGDTRTSLVVEENNEKGYRAALVVAGEGNGGPQVDAGDRDTNGGGAAEDLGARSMSIKKLFWFLF